MKVRQRVKSSIRERYRERETEIYSFCAQLLLSLMVRRRIDQQNRRREKTLCIAFLSLLLLLLIIWLLLIVIPYICFSLFCELNKCQLFFCWGSTFFYDNYFSRLVFCVVVLQFNCFSSLSGIHWSEYQIFCQRRRKVFFRLN